MRQNIIGASENEEGGEWVQRLEAFKHEKERGDRGANVENDEYAYSLNCEAWKY